MSARSTSTRSSGPLIVRITRAFACSSLSVNWALKSAGEAKSRLGMNEVSKNPIASRDHALGLRVARL